MSPDGNPIIGWAPGVDGFLLAAGTCGQGFMLGPGAGKLLTRFITDSLTESDFDILPGIDPCREFDKTEMLK